MWNVLKLIKFYIENSSVSVSFTLSKNEKVDENP